MATPDDRSSIAPTNLRLVLFGLPGAGKSALLGALGEAAQTQKDLLHGQLSDLSHGLSTLQTRLYEQSPVPTAEEVVSYPVAFAPFDDKPTAPVAAVLLDCDGRVVHELLRQTDALANGAPPGRLAAELVSADALVLAVDCSTAAEQLEEQFGEFDRFLRELEAGRSARVDVGGLPVFLVLTKCDLLAQPGDTTVDWMERVEQRKREVGEHFRAFLARRALEMGSVPFGQLDLHLWATAVRRPSLAGTPEKPREPYGVAELFRQCLGQASLYRRRCVQSSRRLFWTAWLAGSAAGALVMLALFLLLWPAPKPPSELQLAVEAMRFDEKSTPAERLRVPLVQLEQRRARLRRWQDDPEFAALPENLRLFIVSRFNEVDKYLEWVDTLNALRRPVTIDTEAGLREVKTQLEKLGGQAHEEWDGTEGLRLYHERLDEVTALLAGIDYVQKQYVGAPTKARNLESFNGYRTDTGGIDWRSWSLDLETLRRDFKPVTFKQTDTLPGSPTLTYAAVMRFDTVADAATLRQRLERERDLAAALGLIGSVAGRPPVLVIERPPAFKLDLSKERVQELEKNYPHYRTEFVRADLPEPMRRELARAAEANYEALLQPARARVLEELPNKGKEDERWAVVRKWLLSDPEELSAWRKLALVLSHLYDPSAPDPVTALAAFLKEPPIPLHVTSLTLELPDSLRRKVPTTAALSIYHRSKSDGKETTLVLVQTKDQDHAGPVLRFEPTKDQPLDYSPGDDLWATLPLPDKREILWASQRSKSYQFECLFRPPLLHKVGAQETEGEVLEGVHVTVSPPDGWPRVPDLLPTTPGSR